MPNKDLSALEKRLATCFVILGLVLVLGSLAWLGASAHGEPLSKEVVTTEPVGEEATGTKTTSETGYAETLIISLVGTGALLILVGVFFGRIKEIKGPGEFAVVLDTETVTTATLAAQATAKKEVTADSDKEPAAQVAAVLVYPELLRAANGTKVVSAEAIGEAAGKKAAEQF